MMSPKRILIGSAAVVAAGAALSMTACGTDVRNAAGHASSAGTAHRVADSRTTSPAPGNTTDASSPADASDTSGTLSTPTALPTPPLPRTSSGSDQPLGTDAQVRAAVLHGPHPGLSSCHGDLAVAGRIVRSTIAPHVVYAAALTTCADAAGLAPSDVTIVEPYGEGPQVVYAAATGTETHDGYQLTASTFAFNGNQLTVVFVGHKPNDPAAHFPQWYQQTSTIGSARAVPGPYVPRSAPTSR